MKAANLPGVFASSAAEIVSPQAVRYASEPGVDASAGGNVPFENRSITSSATCTASAPPFWIRSYQRRPVSSAR
jgi:hypothetical protein